MIIYGNLSGHLRLSHDPSSYINQTINLTGTGNTPAGAQNRVDGSLSSVVIVNATGDGAIVGSGNYTIVGLVINATNSSVELFNHDVNVSFTVTYDGRGEVNTENVISNLTGGATQFFTFSNVWFILTAITILIGMFIGVITLVKKSSGEGFGSKKGRSEFVG